MVGMQAHGLYSWRERCSGARPLDSRGGTVRRCGSSPSLRVPVARTLNEHDSPRVVQAWLTGVNPELGDRVPLRLLKEGNLDEIAPKVLGAARAFIAGA